MKRLTIVTLIFALILPIVSAGTFDEIFNEYKNLENADYVKIPKFLMKLAGNKADLPDDLPIKGKVSGMKILNITDPGNDIGKRINDSAKKRSKPARIHRQLPSDRLTANSLTAIKKLFKNNDLPCCLWG